MERPPRPLQLARRIEPIALLAALWVWLALAGLLAVHGWLALNGRVAPAVALGLAAFPALAMFLLLPHWRRPWAGAAMNALWLGFAVAACVAAGGIGSPMTAAFFIGPALAMRMGDAKAAGEAVVFAALGFALTAFANLPPPTDVFVPASAFFCLVFAVWLLAAPAEGTLRPLPAAAPKTPTSAVALHAASMAHELRTPLNHIVGFAQMIQQQVFGPTQEKYVEYAGLIRDSGDRLLAQVSDLMDLARIEAGRFHLNPEVIDVAALCRQAAAEAAGSAMSKSISIIVQAPDALPADLDPRAVSQILTNLLGNAVKFTPIAGAVVVSAKAAREGVLLQVDDSGPGFPPSAFSRLAQPFERAGASPQTQGTGLGLAIVRALCDAQSGTLSLANGDEIGASVSVYLPNAAPAAKSGAGAQKR